MQNFYDHLASGTALRARTIFLRSVVINLSQIVKQKSGDGKFVSKQIDFLS